MFKFFFTARSVNEATDFYISLIEKAIEMAGSQSSRVYRLSEICKGDIVITIEAKDYFAVKLFKPFNKQICWFQGIVPEEALMMFGSRWRKFLWEFFERRALAGTCLNLFVSQAMQQHYLQKYAYQGTNYLIMPCYNKHINESAFNVSNKYNKPTFVYSGSLATWQCIDQMLQLYKLVEQSIPQATLSILTAEQEKAKKLIAQYKLIHAQVSYCPLSELDQELKKYKYGFIIRNAHIVNRVATPTKMNSYMAMGVIPIYTDVVDAFKMHLNLKGYSIPLSPASSIHQNAEQIITFENKNIINPLELFKIYQDVFNQFYNDSVYIFMLSEKIKKYCL